MDRKIVVDLNLKSFEALISTVRNPLKGQGLFVVMFTASWCKPCKSIKDLCVSSFAKLPDPAVIAVIDIDENLDLYFFMKSKSMLTGVPTLMAWYGPCGDHTNWYVPDRSVAGADEEDIKLFFQQCGESISPGYGKQLKRKICVMNKDGRGC